MASDSARTLAGLSLIGVGVVTILGFVTAEALYPGYSAANDTISALGATGSTPASTLVFNGTMVFSGLLLSVGAYGLHRVYERRLLTGTALLTGLGGFVGVGLFPAQVGVVHFVAALFAFVGAGVTALVVATVVRGPFRYVSAVLGVLELLALVGFVFVGETNPLGVGGIERWVAYLGLGWAVAFGGFVLPSDG